MNRPDIDANIERLARRMCTADGIDPDALVNPPDAAPGQKIPAWWKKAEFAANFLDCWNAMTITISLDQPFRGDFLDRLRAVDSGLGLLEPETAAPPLPAATPLMLRKWAEDLQALAALKEAAECQRAGYGYAALLTAAGQGIKDAVCSRSASILRAIDTNPDNPMVATLLDAKPIENQTDEIGSPRLEAARHQAISEAIQDVEQRIAAWARGMVE